MKVLLSIKPEYAFKIFDGSKKYEFRRVIFKRNDVKKILVYVSSPICKIIGEFEIESILTHEPTDLWELTKDHSGINEEAFFNYFSNSKKGYAIKIKKYRKYKSPLFLNDLVNVGPPQSFFYLE